MVNLCGPRRFYLILTLNTVHTFKRTKVNLMMDSFSVHYFVKNLTNKI